MGKNIYGLSIAKHINGRPLMAKNIYDPPIANKHFNVKKNDLFWIHLIYFEPHWAILIQFDQVWTSLSILNKFE